jgi:hypothetical protein
MIDLAGVGALMPALTAGLELANAAVKKVQEAGNLNVYTDRAKTFADLFDPDKRTAAYASMFSEIQMLCVKKGITPSVPWWDDVKKQGSPTLSIPVSTLKELMDAATK